MIFKLLQPQAIHDEGKRGNQEDTIYPLLGKATTDDRLFIVCDGMGGHEHGEVASGEFTKGLVEYFTRNVNPDVPFTDEMLTDAIAYAYQILDKADDGNYKKMGTTLTLIYMHHGGVTAAHIGDSRIYHIRPGKEILYISRDHSLVFDLYQSGEISFEEMKTYKHKNVITRAVQPGEDNRTHADIIHITDIQEGDYFYLCSDGMLEQMDDDEILQIFSSSDSNEVKRQRLIDATVNNNDNHSAYIVQIEAVQREESDSLISGNEEKTSRYNALNIKPAVIGAAPTDEGVVVAQVMPEEATAPSPEPVAPPPFVPKPDPENQLQPEAVPEVEPMVEETPPPYHGRAPKTTAIEPASSRSSKLRLWPLLLLALAAAAIAAYLFWGGRNKNEGTKSGNDTVTLKIEVQKNHQNNDVRPAEPRNNVEHVVIHEDEKPQPREKEKLQKPKEEGTQKVNEGQNPDKTKNSAGPNVDLKQRMKSRGIWNSEQEGEKENDSSNKKDDGTESNTGGEGPSVIPPGQISGT